MSAPVHETDPLVAALIAKLPAMGAPFPAEARAAWLKMCAMAFDVAYGAAEDIPAFLGAAKPAAAAAKAKPAAPPPPDEDEEPRFYIARDGRALRDPGAKPVGLNDVPTGETIWDERPAGLRDLDSIVWKDGTWPAAALPSLNFASGD